MDIDKFIKYSNNWVALEEKSFEILLASKSLKKLNEMIQDKKLDHIVIHYITDVRKSIAPLCLN